MIIQGISSLRIITQIPRKPQMHEIKWMIEVMMETEITMVLVAPGI